MKSIPVAELKLEEESVLQYLNTVPNASQTGQQACFLHWHIQGSGTKLKHRKLESQHYCLKWCWREASLPAVLEKKRSSPFPALVKYWKASFARTPYSTIAIYVFVWYRYLTTCSAAPLEGTLTLQNLTLRGSSQHSGCLQMHFERPLNPPVGSVTLIIWSCPEPGIQKWSNA